MVYQHLGKTEFRVSRIGFGAFKIGRNTGIKYPSGYDLPDEAHVHQLLNGVLDLGINYIDTAPAYGLSEERIGNAISHRRDEYILSIKAGEQYEHGKSTFDFSKKGFTASIQRSLQLLKTESIDLVYIHSNGNDLQILNETDAVETLHTLKEQGLVKAIGFSGKTAEGAEAALAWADAVMVEYNLDNRSHEDVMSRAKAQGIGVVVKKGLASGSLNPDESIRFVLDNPTVDTLIIGGLNLEHIRENVGIAENLI